MTTPHDGGPAFPVQDAASFQAHDMTLRDYFAAKAMHALLRGDGTSRFENRAKDAYDMADAMMAERAARAQGEK